MIPKCIKAKPKVNHSVGILKFGSVLCPTESYTCNEWTPPLPKRSGTFFCPDTYSTLFFVVEKGLLLQESLDDQRKLKSADCGGLSSTVTYPQPQ